MYKLISILSMTLFSFNAVSGVCGSISEVESDYKKFPHVFIGDIVKIYHSRVDGNLYDAADIKLTTSYKGNNRDLITVYSGEVGISTSYQFKLGKQYAVFAHEWKNRIRVSFCSNTVNLSDTHESNKTRIDKVMNFLNTIEVAQSN